MSARRGAVKVFLIIILFSLFSCAHKKNLNHRLSWDGDNRSKIDAFISKNREKNKLAIFDWDNTVIKNDVGDATTFYMLLNNEIMTPKSWEKTSKHLTKQALNSLNKYCPLKGKFLDTKQRKSCAMLWRMLTVNG